jgi:drug/metabolite transporter (DMT)-like permease
MGGTAYAEQTIGSGLVVAFIAIVPLLTVALNRLFGVVPARRELVAVVIGAAGVGLLTRGAGFRASPAGLAAISIATTSWALGSLLSRHRLPLAPGAIGYASEMLAGGVLLLVASAWRGESWSLPTAPVPWGAWAYLVVFGSLLAFSAYMTLLARTSVAVAASYSFVNPIVALLLGVVIGGEQITPGEWVAASVIVGSVLVLLVRRP